MPLLGLNGGLLGPPSYFPRSGIWTPNENYRAKWTGETVPIFQAAGSSAAVTSTTALNLSWPTHQANDIGILLIEAENTITTITPAGWTHVTGSPLVVGDTKLHVLWARADSSAMPDVSNSTNCNHKLGVIVTFRGCITTGNPWNVITTGSKTTASNTATVPSLTTTVNNTLVVMIVSRPDDDASTTHFGVPVNATLNSIAKYGEFGTDLGHGGGFVVAGGIKATSGATGTSTLSKTASTTDAYVTFALRGPNA